jgi:hypothetical protein
VWPGSLDARVRFPGAFQVTTEWGWNVTADVGGRSEANFVKARSRWLTLPASGTDGFEDVGFVAMDLEDSAGLRGALRDYRPDLIINTAGECEPVWGRGAEVTVGACARLSLMRAGVVLVLVQAHSSTRWSPRHSWPPSSSRSPTWTVRRTVRHNGSGRDRQRSSRPRSVGPFPTSVYRTISAD